MARRNNDCFVIDYLNKKQTLRNQLFIGISTFLKTNKYNIDEDTLWNAGFTLKKSKKVIIGSDYEYISFNNSDDNSIENYTKGMEVY